MIRVGLRLWLLCFLVTVVGLLASPINAEEQDHAVQLKDGQLQHVQAIFETHIQFQDIFQGCSSSHTSLRHQKQRNELLSQLEKSGNDVHEKKGPRYRLLQALYGFSRYEEVNSKEINRLESLYDKTSKQKKKFVESALKHRSNFKDTRTLFASNNQLIKKIISQALEHYQVSEQELTSFITSIEADDKKDKPKPDRVSMSQALKHIVRDWSVEGFHEWSDSYDLIKQTLIFHFPRHLNNSNTYYSTTEPPLRILLPGSGLNRIAHEVARFGPVVEVTANEFSPYMNIVYNYISTINTPSSMSFHPYIDSWSHQPSRAELHRRVRAPDTLPCLSDVVLVEGDFLRVFNDRKAEQWSATQDVLITHFFLDTARNVLSYIENIHRLLKPGGIWLNLGPLLWSYNAELQLSLEEVVRLSEAVGFEFLETDPNSGPETIPGSNVRSIHAPYGFNSRTLSQNAYKAQFWVARKQ